MTDVAPQNDGLAVLVSDLANRSSEWRAARRAEALAITCPSCEAIPQIECVTRMGTRAAIIHVRRYDKKNFLKPDEGKKPDLQLGMPW